MNDLKFWPVIRHVRAIVATIRYCWVIVLWEPQKPPNHFARLRHIMRIEKGQA